MTYGRCVVHPHINKGFFSEIPILFVEDCRELRILNIVCCWKCKTTVASRRAYLTEIVREHNTLIHNVDIYALGV